MDWNWFFSSISQSAAAIVGLLGAFVISKILSNQTTFQEKKVQIDTLINDAKKLTLDAESLAIGWYIKHQLESTLEEIDSEIEEDNDVAFKPTDYFLEKYRFPRFESRENLEQKITEHIDIIQKEIIETRASFKEYQQRENKRLQEPTTRSILDTFSNLNLPDINGYFSARPPSGTWQRSRDLSSLSRPWPAIEAEGDKIMACISQAQHHTQKIKDFLPLVLSNPESSSLIRATLWLLLLLFFVGVIYPLSFLPQPVNAAITLSLEAFIPTLFSIKGLMLAPLGVIFTIIMSAFYLLNRSLKYPGEKTAELLGFTNLNKYSINFEYWEEHKNREASKTSKTPED